MPRLPEGRCEVSEPETITLPRSGVPLTPDGFFAYESPHGAFLIDPESWGGSVDEWQARHPRGFSEVGEEFVGTRDGCIEWLDARVLALRAAIMPTDAEERIARAIAGDPCNFPSAVWDNIEPEDQLLMRRQARAVLAALNGRDGAK